MKLIFESSSRFLFFFFFWKGFGNLWHEDGFYKPAAMSAVENLLLLIIDNVAKF